MRNEHRVITPESVEFVYELAGLGSRMLAVLLDHLILLGVLFCIWIAGCLLLPLTLAVSGLNLALAILATFLIYFGYFAYFEWKWNGQTPGKRYMDLRVIDDRGMNIDLFQSLMRNLFRLVDMMPFLFGRDFLSFGFYGIGGLAALINPRGKRLGDWAAGTLVVRVRKRVMPSAILAPNEKYNSLLDDAPLRGRIRRLLTLEERETLLQLCLRRNELEFEARQSLFAEAAAHLEERLEISRPAFLSKEKFVQNIAAVVLAEDGTVGYARAPSAAGRR
jgi:uncharacterized RDD family membrane protein YckC